MPKYFWKAHNNKKIRWGLTSGSTAVSVYKDIQKELEANQILDDAGATLYEMDLFNKVED